MFHITPKSNVESILANGFDLSCSGTEGGAQCGKGIYLCQSPATWEHHLFADANEIAWLKVNADLSGCFDMADWESEKSSGFVAWLSGEGWTAEGGMTEKAQKLIADCGGHESDAIWHLRCQFLAAQGFDGVIDRKMDNIVIWNLNKIDSIEEVKKEYR